MSHIKQTTRRPTILLADDHKGTAEQLRTLLQLDFDVIALVEDGRALVSAAAQFSPDVIVTDISMPKLDGIDATALIRRRDPNARIVFVTVHSDTALVQRSLATGALGYVLKDAAGDELVSAVQAALRGERFVSAALRHINGKSDPN